MQRPDGGWPEQPCAGHVGEGRSGRTKAGRIGRPARRCLDAIGFAWGCVGDRRWEDMYAQLAEYRDDHGHCRISTLSDEHRALGNWIHKRSGRCTSRGCWRKARIAQLDDIDFTWDLRREQWETNFAAPGGLPPHDRALRRANALCAQSQAGQLGDGAAGGL